jgi:intracellular septation protein
MLNVLYDFIVVVLFFITFKFYGIYAATLVGIVSSLLQVVITRLYHKKYDKKQLIVMFVFLLFGGMTLYFHDPIFVKWKPTIVFWIFSLAFFATQWIGKRPLMERMMGQVLEEKKPIPKAVWRKLNLAWALFFLTLGALNIFVLYHFTTDTWVNFKLYGIFSATLLFGFAQAFFLSRYITK